MLQQLAQTHSAISTMFYCCNQSRGVASVTSDITFRMQTKMFSTCHAHFLAEYCAETPQIFAAFTYFTCADGLRRTKQHTFNTHFIQISCKYVKTCSIITKLFGNHMYT